MPTRTLYEILHKFGIWFTPIILIIFSLSLNLPNSALHKATLRNSNFYNQLSSELNGFSLDENNVDRGFSGILFSAVLKDLATPGWLQNLFERNIDLSSEWMEGKNENLTLYLPSEDIQLATSKNIDSQTKQIGTEFASKIPTCSKEDEEKIIREGFSLDEEGFCLPETVSSGQQQLTEFLGLKSTDSKQSILDKIVKNNQLKVSTEKFKAQDLLVTNAQKSLLKRLNFIRDLFLRISAVVPFALVLSFLLLIADLFLAKSMNRKLGKELRKYLFYVASSTISLAALIILALGATTYFTSFVRNLFFPGIATTRIINLFALEIVKFSFNITSIAIWISLAFLVFNLIYQFLENSGVLHNPEAKNSRLMRKSAIATGAHNPTLDGQFHNQRRPKLDFEKEEGFYAQNTDVNFSTPIPPANSSKSSQMNQNFNTDYYGMQELKAHDTEYEVLQNLDEQRPRQNSLLEENQNDPFASFSQDRFLDENNYNLEQSNLNNLNQTSPKYEPKKPLNHPNSFTENTRQSSFQNNFPEDFEETQNTNSANTERNLNHDMQDLHDQELQRYIENELNKSQQQAQNNADNSYYQANQSNQNLPPSHIGNTTRPDGSSQYRDFELNLKKPKKRNMDGF